VGVVVGVTLVVGIGSSVVAMGGEAPGTASIG